MTAKPTSPGARPGEVARSDPGRLLPARSPTDDPPGRSRRGPARRRTFIADVHLGRLARRLRLLGFDTVYRNDLDDPDIVAIAVAEDRAILTRDHGLLARRAARDRGLLIASGRVAEQVRQVLTAFDLFGEVDPFRFCLACNGRITTIERARAVRLVPAHIADKYAEFFTCDRCGKIYWEGDHLAGLDRIVEESGPPTAAGGGKPAKGG
ncbi:MAG: hypothetical protein GX442_01675 [Candidatus Riflebacteria bacterium]|nr:hypothetical protein [Candidatus Riflebacteria bacterium]